MACFFNANSTVHMIYTVITAKDAQEESQVHGG